MATYFIPQIWEKPKNEHPEKCKEKYSIILKKDIEAYENGGKSSVNRLRVVAQVISFISLAAILFSVVTPAAMAVSPQFSAFIQPCIQWLPFASLGGALVMTFISQALESSAEMKERRYLSQLRLLEMLKEEMGLLFSQADLPFTEADIPVFEERLSSDKMMKEDLLKQQHEHAERIARLMDKYHLFGEVVGKATMAVQLGQLPDGYSEAAWNGVRREVVQAKKELYQDHPGRLKKWLQKHFYCSASKETSERMQNYRQHIAVARNRALGSEGALHRLTGNAINLKQLKKNIDQSNEKELLAAISKLGFYELIHKRFTELANKYEASKANYQDPKYAKLSQNQKSIQKVEEIIRYENKLYMALILHQYMVQLKARLFLLGQNDSEENFEAVKTIVQGILNLKLDRLEDLKIHDLITWLNDFPEKSKVGEWINNFNPKTLAEFDETVSSVTSNLEGFAQYFSAAERDLRPEVEKWNRHPFYQIEKLKEHIEETKRQFNYKRVEEEIKALAEKVKALQGKEITEQSLEKWLEEYGALEKEANECRIKSQNYSIGEHLTGVSKQIKGKIAPKNRLENRKVVPIRITDLLKKIDLSILRTARFQRIALQWFVSSVVLTALLIIETYFFSNVWFGFGTVGITLVAIGGSYLVQYRLRSLQKEKRRLLVEERLHNPTPTNSNFNFETEWRKVRTARFKKLEVHPKNYAEYEKYEQLYNSAAKGVVDFDLDDASARKGLAHLDLADDSARKYAHSKWMVKEGVKVENFFIGRKRKQPPKIKNRKESAVVITA